MCIVLLKLTDQLMIKDTCVLNVQLVVCVGVDVRVSTVFTSAVTDLLDDCSEWPIIVIATTTSRSSLSICLHDLFVHSTDFDVCLSLCLSVCVGMSVFVSFYPSLSPLLDACLYSVSRVCRESHSLQISGHQYNSKLVFGFYSS